MEKYSLNDGVNQIKNPFRPRNTKIQGTRYNLTKGEYTGKIFHFHFSQTGSTLRNYWASWEEPFLLRSLFLALQRTNLWKVKLQKSRRNSAVIWG